MRNTILLQPKQIRVFVITLIVLCCGVLFQNAAWSENNIATATDETDTVVAGKIIQQQQAQASKPQINSQAASSVTPQTQVANDMADGESIRGLPTLNQPVIDQANVLSETEKQQLSQKILNLYQQGKAQIGIVIVPTTGQEDIFDYALRVGEKWQLGSSKRDNGLLIAVAINDHRIQILTGYGLEGVLPDIVASRIIRNQITPYFKQAQYAQGLNAGLDEIGRILNLDPEVAQQAAQDLKERQHQAAEEQQAKQTTLTMALFILVAGVVGSFIVGRPLSASTAGVAAAVAGFVNGAGVVMSLLLGFGIFFLLITSIAQLILQAILSGAGGGGRGEVIINISMSTLSDIECRVLDNRLHAGVIPLVMPLSGLDYFDLYSESSFLYCGKNHPLFNQCSSINLNELKKWQAILPNYAITSEAVKLHQLLDCKATASDREGIAFLILTGKFLGFLPDHYAKKWVEDGVMQPVLKDKMHYSTPMCLITHKGKSHNNILKTFMEMLEKRIANN